MPELAIGDFICDRWNVRRIMRGGVGIVYLVVDRDSSIYVAKTFQNEIIQKQFEWRARFTQECTAWISIDPHPNITEALLVREFAGKPYVLMEFVEGGTLAERIRSHQSGDRLPAMLRFAIQFCDGMVHAYQAGIVAHRDIKPANCLITRNDTLKITDFGLARAIGTNTSGRGPASDKASYVERPLARFRAPAPSGRLTMVANGVFGTPAYMAPEQFEDFGSVTALADVYSFGVMFFEMIAGSLPFPGTTLEECYRLHKSARPPELPNHARWSAKVAQRLSTLTKSCLEKSPKLRPGSFAEIRKELETVFKLATGSVAPQESNAPPVTAHELILRGEGLCALKKWDQAIAYLERALQLSPQNARAQFELATTHYLKGDQTRALLHFEKALALDPTHSLTWAHRAASLERAGRYREAMESCEQALALDSQCWMASAVKGRLLRHSGKYAAARDALVEAIKIYPFQPTCRNWLADVLKRLGDRDHAENLYRSSLELDPWSAETWYDLGVLLGEQGRFQDEIECYNHALQLEPKHSNALTNKGVALLALNRATEGLGFLDQALAINPNDKIAWFMKAEILFVVLKRYADARTCYLHAKSLGQAITPGRIEACDGHIGSK